MARRPLTVAEVLALPASTDIVTAGRALGISREASYDRAQDGTFPCSVLRVGHRWVVPTAGLRRVLGLDEAARAS
jgi:hypothetical protein